MDRACSGVMGPHEPAMGSGNFHSKAPQNKQSSVLASAARKKRAIFAVPRPLVGKTKYTGMPHFHRHLEYHHAPLPSYYSPKQCNHYHYEGRRIREQQGERWRRPRLSRSLSPNRHDRSGAYDEANLFVDYTPPNEEDMEFLPPLTFHGGGNGSGSEDEWEDECKVVDELDASGSPNITRGYNREELEYLKRMLIKFRNRKKELFPHKKGTGCSPIRNQSHHQLCSYRCDSCSRFGRDTDYERRLGPPPPSRSIYDGKSASKYSTSYRVDVHGLSHVPRSSWRELSPSPPVPDSGRSTRYCTPRLPQIRENLKLATSTRTYPTRTYGRALHVQRWLSDRYTTQTRFNFGDLPKSEGVKDSYIQDPNDPNKFLNVPRPLKPLPGTRGDYYNGAAWKDYQRHKKEWFKNKGCYYPDVWVRCGNGGLDTTMASANREVRKGSDKMMCDEQPDSAARGSGLHDDNRRHTHIPWPSWRDQSDMESVTSKDDHFSIASQTNSLVPQTIIDHNIDSISIGIANTIINTAILKPTSATPASSETASTNRIAIMESGTNEALVSASKDKEFNTNELMAPSSLVILSDPEVPKAFRVALSQPLQNSRSPTSVPAVNNVDMSTIRAFHHKSVSKNTEKGVQNSSTVASSTPTLTSRALISSPKPTPANNSVMIPGHDWDRGWNMDWRYHF